MLWCTCKFRICSDLPYMFCLSAWSWKETKSARSRISFDARDTWRYGTAFCFCNWPQYSSFHNPSQSSYRKKRKKARKKDKRKPIGQPPDAFLLAGSGFLVHLRKKARPQKQSGFFWQGAIKKIFSHFCVRDLNSFVFSEIFCLSAKCEIISLRKLWNIAPSPQCEMKFASSRAKRISHAKHISRSEGVFHSPKANFVEKALAFASAFSWQGH